MAEFDLHPQLLRDTHRLGRLPLCHLLLHKNGALPWFILVPETNVTDLLDLADELRATALSEASQVSGFIKQYLNYPKINFAAIGNVVPQLHLHVIGRKPDDPCWPLPVWGHLPEMQEYAAVEVRRLKEKLQVCLASDFSPAQEDMAL